MARSWVRNHAYELGLTQDPTENIMRNRSLHVHCPSGAVPKDGPSSGMAQAIALISLLSGRPVSPKLAMTVSATRMLRGFKLLTMRAGRVPTFGACEARRRHQGEADRSLPCRRQDRHAAGAEREGCSRGALRSQRWPGDYLRRVSCYAKLRRVPSHHSRICLGSY